MIGSLNSCHVDEYLQLKRSRNTTIKNDQGHSAFRLQNHHLTIHFHPKSINNGHKTKLLMMNEKWFPVFIPRLNQLVVQKVEEVDNPDHSGLRYISLGKTPISLETKDTLMLPVKLARGSLNKFAKLLAWMTAGNDRRT